MSNIEKAIELLEKDLNDIHEPGYIKQAIALLRTEQSCRPEFQQQIDRLGLCSRCVHDPLSCGMDPPGKTATCGKFRPQHESGRIGR